MNIHEYQAKNILKRHGVATLSYRLATTADEAAAAASELGGNVWVVKAQVHAGGRGKGGGVKLARSVDEVRSIAEEMIGMTLVTHQTGPAGTTVHQVLVEEGCDIASEFYVGVVLDRASGRIAVMASSEGGVEIEEVAKTHPEAIRKVTVDPAVGLSGFQTRQLAFGIGLPSAADRKAGAFFTSLYEAFVASDASIAEINPLVLTGDGDLIALDAKMNFDDNALFRHSDIAELRDEREEEPTEREAREQDLAFIKLDGTIGCLVNGAGLAMSTMDIIKLHGGEPANFLDVGGGATAEKVTAAFKMILRDTSVEAILVNIFGGIMKCDVIAEGVIAATRELGLEVPLVVRLNGTNVDLGRRILDESGLNIISADDLSEAAEKVVAAIGN